MWVFNILGESVQSACESHVWGLVVQVQCGWATVTSDPVTRGKKGWREKGKLKSSDSKERSPSQGVNKTILCSVSSHLQIQTESFHGFCISYRSGLWLLGLPQGDVGGDGGRLGRVHGRFGPGRDDAHRVGGHCWRDIMRCCHLHISKQTLQSG